MKKIRNLLTPLIFLGFLFVPVQLVGAVNAFDGVCTDEQAANNVVCQNKDEKEGDIVTTVINTLLFITGLLSVIMIIVGGLRYTTSRGNQNSITEAKNTILYAVVGLVVSLVAFAIVNWIMTLF